MIRLFEGNNHAELYLKYRLATPKFLVDKIVEWMRLVPVDSNQPVSTPDMVFDAAVDVGCGSGQNTVPFAPYFDRIYGFDVSEAQISAALHQSVSAGNVSYAVARAEQLPLADRSVQLVTGSFSFHWFDLHRFYAEVDRVLCPGGVVAALGHSTLRVVYDEPFGEQLNHLVDDFVTRILKTQLHEKAAPAFNSYLELPLPYPDELREAGLSHDVVGTLGDVLGAFSTWSPFQKLCAEQPQTVIAAADEFRKRFKDVLGLDVDTLDEDVPLVLRYDYFVAMCRKPR